MSQKEQDEKKQSFTTQIYPSQSWPLALICCFVTIFYSLFGLSCTWPTKLLNTRTWPSRLAPKPRLQSRPGPSSGGGVFPSLFWHLCPAPGEGTNEDTRRQFLKNHLRPGTAALLPSELSTKTSRATWSARKLRMSKSLLYFVPPQQV